MSARIEALEKLLTSNIEAFLARGGTLICGYFGDSIDQACAVSCHRLEKKKLSFVFEYADDFSVASGFLFSAQEVWAVIFGFDDNSKRSNICTDFYQLGFRLREKFKPIQVDRSEA